MFKPRLVFPEGPVLTVAGGHFAGRGDRGLRRADEPTGTSTNSMFIIALDDFDLIDKIVEEIRPILSRSGGICLVSDAQWVRH